MSICQGVVHKFTQLMVCTTITVEIIKLSKTFMHVTSQGFLKVNMNFSMIFYVCATMSRIKNVIKTYTFPVCYIYTIRLLGLLYKMFSVCVRNIYFKTIITPIYIDILPDTFLIFVCHFKS